MREQEGSQFIFIIVTSKDSNQAIKHSIRQKTSIQRGRKLDLKGISQHYMFSYKFPLLLIMHALSILYPQITILFLLPPPFNSPPPLLGLVLLRLWSLSSPPPSSAYAYKYVSDRVSGQGELFVSCKSYKDGVGCGIKSVGFYKIYSWGQGIGQGFLIQWSKTPNNANWQTKK